jgi:hypothetical protein
MANNTWITTPLEEGPLSVDNYTMNIEGLDPDSVYSYRAYMVADGIPRFGEVQEGNTSSIPQYPPQVTTGAAECISDTCMRVCNNLMTSNGDSGICEYGLLYTQVSALANVQNLRYSNYPSTVCMKFVCSDIPEYVDFMNELTGLSDNSGTYFRAFAINGVDIAFLE